MTEVCSEIEKEKASVEKFMDYLLSTMAHKVSQRCRIYQLEDVCARLDESPDKFMLCTLDGGNLEHWGNWNKVVLVRCDPTV